MTPDYGIDLDVEIFEYEDGHCVTQGEHIFLQVKGTHNAKYTTYTVYKNDDTSLNSKCKIETLAFSLETPLLNLIRKMGTALPVLLVVVDLNSNNSFFVCLNDYIDKVLDIRNPNFDNQKTVTIHIPLENKFSKENLNVVRMYAKRSKLCALLNQLNSFALNSAHWDECLYERKIKRTLGFLSSIINSHAWSTKEFIGVMKETYKNIIFLLENDGLNEFNLKQLSDFSKDGKNPNTEIWYYSTMEIPMPYKYALQMASINQLIYSLNNIVCIFEDDIRAFYLPTYFYLLIFDSWES